MLPQLRPALYGGMLLVALNTMVEFGALALLRFRTFTTEIYCRIQGRLQWTRSLDAVPGAGGPVPPLPPCGMEVARPRRYARVDRGTVRRMKPKALGGMAVPVVLGFLALVATTVGVPLGMIVYWLLRHNSAAISPVVASVPALAGAALSSIELGLGGAALTLVLALPIAYLAAATTIGS